MGKYAALLIVAAALAGCTTYDRTSAAGGSAPAANAVDVKMDSDGSVRRYATDFNLREGDRVRVTPEGKVAPL
ncbi:MAG TPA: hypothetical protein VEQ87_24060 [Burkholderiales bacterium]|nr:hypothetical protein [Burkholderiales bacterium]